MVTVGEISSKTFDMSLSTWARRARTGGIQTTIEEQEKKDIPDYMPYTRGDNDMKKIVLNKRVVAWVSRTDTLESNMEKAFTVIIGQRTSHLQSNLEALPSWSTIKKTHDLMSLLKKLLKLTHRYDS